MSRKPGDVSLELWGGVECTVNRVGEAFFDQVARAGHDRRPSDLDRIAGLGLRTLRYPVLWEWAAAQGPGAYDWAWADARLERLRRLGVRPIVGLVHHGSGPRFTHLLDPGFAEGLAEYAGRLAERFPWLALYTPVNEPLTTARFSGLYGHWYPHGRDGRTFLRCLLTQCRAVVLAMRAVRRVRPDARLVQTEDLGRTHSTPALRYQADFENERRWLTFDLLCGRVDPGHPLASYFRFEGVADAEWLWFRDNPCPPDILGVNHYLTSERFLDERLDRYPACSHGGNGRQAYADVEAVRVCGALTGPAGLLREAWARFRLPLAVTEAHLGCSREEQLRWLAEVWRAAGTVRAEGVDVRAVTVWSLLGACDWDSLATRAAGHYEPGAFDLRGPRPRPTALAGLVRELAGGRAPSHPVLAVPGWWRRPDRLTFPLEGVAVDGDPAQEPVRARPVLIAGGAGVLAGVFARACALRGLPYRLLTRAALDITKAAAVESALAEFDPWAVINAAGFAHVDRAEQDPPACRRVHVDGPLLLAERCAAAGIGFVTFSADHVFDGGRRTPYREADAVNPLNVFGACKAEAERLVATRHPGALIVRSGPLVGAGACFVDATLRALAAGLRFAAADDETVSPTFAWDLVNACLDLLIDGASGVWHLANGGAVTWADLARETARRAGLEASAVRGRPLRSFSLQARRPLFRGLDSERGAILPPLEAALARYPFADALRGCVHRAADPGVIQPEAGGIGA